MLRFCSTRPHPALYAEVVAYSESALVPGASGVDVPATPRGFPALVVRLGGRASSRWANDPEAVDVILPRAFLLGQLTRPIVNRFAGDFRVFFVTLQPTAPLALLGPDNQPPLIATLNGPEAGDEAAPLDYTASASDPDGDPLTYSWDFDGDGTTDQAGVDLTSVTHAYPDDGTYTLTLTVDDGNGETATRTLDVEISNVDPTIVDLTGDTSGEEGAAFAYDATATDPADAPLADAWDFGDGGATSGDGLASVQHVYTTAGTYTLALTVSDGDGGSDTESLTVVVVEPNQTPVIASLTGDTNGVAGSSFAFTADATDPDGDVLTYAWDFDGDGTDDQGGLEATATHVYASVGTYTLGLTVTDGNGGSDTATLEVVVVEPAPTNRDPVVASLTGDQAGAEGDTFAFTADASDPDGDALTYAWDLDGDGTDDQTGPEAAVTHVYATAGTYTLGLVVTDGNGGSASATLEVVVSEPQNQVPVVTAVGFPPEPIAVGEDLVVTASFTDPDAGDVHTCAVEFGTGDPVEGTVDEESGTCTAAHAYPEAGIYTVAVTVTDAEGAAGTGTADAYVVVYDPSAGFVTGGGWVDSPEGAYPADPSLTGKASFGFVAKYKRGRSVPDGTTEFQFRAARFNLHSTAYEWLVVAGTRAKFKGTATVNGEGDYGFMLTATDGDPDLFRIKVWDRSTDAVVYDNQLGADDDGYAGTELGGGQVVLHNKAESRLAVSASASPEARAVAPAEFALHPPRPNPASGAVRVAFDVPEAAHVRVRVVDLLGREVAVLADDEVGPGAYEVRWDGAGPLPAGVYLVRLEAGPFVATQRVTLLR